MRVYEILKSYNIGIDSLNDYLEFAGLDKVNVNSRLDEIDYNYICKLLNSSHISKYDEVLSTMHKNLQQIKKELQKELLNVNMPVDNIGLLQRKYLFKKIMNDYFKVIVKNHLLSSLDYSNESFEKLYLLWSSGELKKMEKQRYMLSEEDEATLYDSICSEKEKENCIKLVDGESEIMSALRNGNGDKYGF